jgi:protein gp37
MRCRHFLRQTVAFLVACLLPMEVMLLSVRVVTFNAGASTLYLGTSLSRGTVAAMLDHLRSVAASTQFRGHGRHRSKSKF